MDRDGISVGQLNSFLTKNTLWAGFDANKSLQPSKINEVRYDGITYAEYFFSGRDVKGERVRIFGMFATPDDVKSYNAILYLPDVSESPSFDMIMEYAKMGYAVFAVDFCGKTDSERKCTSYPESVAYANYHERGRSMDFVDKSAFETAWYEWASVGRYAISFLASQPKVKNIGVIGVKHGSNIAWQLAATDDRIKCSVMMFGAGWYAYKGHFKYDDGEGLVINDERRRFIAALEAHAYAQDARCPILYVSSTNNDSFDFDRSFDTLFRIPDATDHYFNFAPSFNEYLDNFCKKDVELFLKKYLNGKDTYFPQPPTLNAEQDGRYITVNIAPDDEENVTECKVFVNEGVVDPALRNWMPCEQSQYDKNEYEYVLTGESTKIFAFATVKYKSGVTVSSKLVHMPIVLTHSKRSGIVYTSKDGLDGITFYDKKSMRESIFARPEQFIKLVKGAGDIYGAYSECGLISYKFGEPGCNVDENSIIKLDVHTREFCVLRLIFMQKTSNGVVEYVYSTECKASTGWKNLVVKTSEFKTVDGMGIRSFDGLYALRIEGDGKFAVNNILLI